MSRAIDEVMNFFAEWETIPQMRRSMQARFTPQTVWENVGVCTTVGIDEALAFMDGFNAQLGVERGEVVVHHIAVAGEAVLTERTDIFYKADGSVAVSIRLMGVMESSVKNPQAPDR